MKRALIVLLLLAVAGGLFAQVAFSGHVRSGIAVFIPSEGDTTLSWYSRDPGAGYRFQLGASYTHDSGRAGAAATIRLVDGAFGHDGANVWVEPIDNVIRLQAGTGGPGGFGSLGGMDVSNDAAGGGTFAIKFTPALDGMSFAAGASVNASNATFDKSRYNFGVSFGLPNLINAVANLAYIGSTEVTNVAAGIGVLALNAASGQTGLTRLAVDVSAPNVTDLTWIGIGPVVGFRVAGVGAGDLSATLRTQIYLPMSDELELDYAALLSVGVPIISGVTFNLGVGFEGKGALPTANETTHIFDYREWDGLPRSISSGTDPQVNVHPSVAFTIGNGTLTTGLGLQALLADEVKIQNAIYLQFSVGF